jgi:iron complex transport system permease protein
MIASLMLGSIYIPVSIILNSITNDNEIYKKVLFDIRLPRILNSIFAGASLSCSGLILQSLVKNKLAEPGLLGISAGAGLGAILVFLFPIGVTFFIITPISFIFAVLTTTIIFYLGKKFSRNNNSFINTNKLILAGIAISALLNALNGYLLLTAGNNVQQILFWLSGGFSGRGWNEFYISFVFSITGIIATVLISSDLNLLSLGDEMSSSLGINLKRTQILSIIISSLLAASAVSVAGIITFVGLVIPNIANLLIGNDYRYTVPCSIILGALFLLVSDTIARLIISPSEVPVSIITSLLGGPVFIYLIFKMDRQRIN